MISSPVGVISTAKALMSTKGRAPVLITSNSATRLVIRPTTYPGTLTRSFSFEPIAPQGIAGHYQQGTIGHVDYSHIPQLPYFRNHPAPYLTGWFFRALNSKAAATTP